MKKITPFLLLFFLFTSLVKGQEIDTLSTKSITQIKALINNNVRFNPKTAIFYSNYLLNQSIKTQDYNNQCLAYNFIGKSNRVLGNNNLALKNQLQAKSLLKNVTNPDIAVKVYNALGNTYSDLGIYNEVLPNYFEAIKIAETNNLRLSEILLKHNLAYFKDQIGEYDDALSILKENKIRILQGEDSLIVKEQFIAKNDLLHAMVLTKLNQPDSVIYYANKGLKQTIKFNDNFSEQGIHNFLGIAYTQKNEFKKALKHFKTADSLGLLLGNNTTLFEHRYSLALLHYKMKEYDKTIEILEHSIKVTEKDSLNYSNNDDNYKLLAEAYKEKGDYEKANFYFEGYILKYNLNKDLHYIIDDNFEQNKINAFKGELETLQKEKSKQESYLTYLSLGAALIILVLLFYLLKFYKTKKQNELKFQELLKKVNTAEKPIVVDTKDVVLEESTATDVNQETKQQILEGLQKLETQEYFLKQECNSYNVAKKIKTNTSYLSKVINSHYQKNFNTYINDLRINYAIVRLKNDSRFRSFSIQSIAEELGYKSADSFTKYFKQHTGLNPSFYIKQLNNLA